MKPDQQKKILIDYLLMKVSLEDWRSVEDAARDLRSLPNQVQVMERPSLPVKTDPEVSPAAIPPVQMDIPHHSNEVLSLLRMDDASLVDKMFPDYSELQEGSLNANA